MLYPLAPATAVHVSVAALCVTAVDARPEVKLQGGIGVENVDEAEKALEFEAEQTDLT